ncbi:MAG: sigma 54-dependent Fis family transcriptional regulator [Myxococcales bacterium]|nr:sigma 54-dependent Fis family transcriptional regulator [Myxococcales bacterium]
MTTTFAPPTASRQIRRVLLRVSEGPDAGAQIQVSRSRLTVGRAAVNDLVLGDTSVSGIHAEILLDRRGILLRDLGSTNGTQVQGVRIREAWIEPGMTLEVGKTAITLLAADEVDVPLSRRDHFGALYGGSPAMREVFAVLERIAGTEMSVLIHGETGTGKELVARALHDESPRERRPFVVLDCGSLPRELAEASILGHKKGSFTGALTDRPGAFEEAEGGTLFLDEVAELPLELQPKLLRVLDRREVQRLGEHQVRKVDVRVVAATHRDLRTMVSQGEFREDLYFMLAVVACTIPPLRERREDIPMLIEVFSRRLPPGMWRAPDPEAMARLVGYDWPGNVRELRNVVERSAYLSPNGVIDLITPGARSPSQEAPVAFDPTLTFREQKERAIELFEEAYLAWLLQRAEGNISRAAREADMDRKYLHKLLRRYGIDAKQFAPSSGGRPGDARES